MPPADEFYFEPRTQHLVICFRVITRRSWDEMQAWRDAFPGSRLEHIHNGAFVLLAFPGVEVVA